MSHIVVRPIAPADNEALATVIRGALKEFGANKPGTVYYDPTTDALYELFSGTPGSFYQVAELDGVLVGGGGIYPTEGLPQGTCELVKMYLHRDARGQGLGGKLIAGCIEGARKLGYTQIYLETMPELKKALDTYEKFGFRYLTGPMGNSGHFGCDLWMAMEVVNDKS